jgi:hypothetical protein
LVRAPGLHAAQGYLDGLQKLCSLECDSVRLIRVSGPAPVAFQVNSPPSRSHVIVDASNGNKPSADQTPAKGKSFLMAVRIPPSMDDTRRTSSVKCTIASMDHVNRCVLWGIYHLPAWFFRVDRWQSVSSAGSADGASKYETIEVDPIPPRLSEPDIFLTRPAPYTDIQWTRRIPNTVVFPEDHPRCSERRVDILEGVLGACSFRLLSLAHRILRYPVLFIITIV